MGLFSTMRLPREEQARIRRDAEGWLMLHRFFMEQERLLILKRLLRK